jgi:hypothetical protein
MVKPLNLTKMLLKSPFNMTTHNHAQVCKQKKQAKNSDGPLFPTRHRAINLTPSDSHFFGVLKAPMEKGVRVIMLLKKWL